MNVRLLQVLLDDRVDFDITEPSLVTVYIETPK
jgi:hypothetical protein